MKMYKEVLEWFLLKIVQKPTAKVKLIKAAFVNGN